METEISQGFHDFFNKKRKRFTTVIPQHNNDVNGNCDDVDFDEGDYLNTDEFEIHDGINKDGMVMKKTHKPRSHKVIITEEKMTDALRELQLDREKKQSEFNFYLTDELRSSIDKFKNDDDELKQRFLNLNKKCQEDPSKHMQIIPWIQNEKSEKIISEPEAKTEYKSSSSTDGSMDSFENFSQDSSDNFNKYKVEEPSEKKNLLKRKHSEVNELTIEELKPTENSPSNITNHYLVELPVDEAQASAQSPSQSPNFNFNFNNEQAAQQPNVLITEFIESPLVTCFKDVKNRRIVDDEEMDL